jgi:hypothetical protein
MTDTKGSLWTFSALGRLHNPLRKPLKFNETSDRAQTGATLFKGKLRQNRNWWRAVSTFCPTIKIFPETRQYCLKTVILHVLVFHRTFGWHDPRGEMRCSFDPGQRRYRANIPG